MNTAKRNGEKFGRKHRSILRSKEKSGYNTSTYGGSYDTPWSAAQNDQTAADRAAQSVTTSPYQRKPASGESSQLQGSPSDLLHTSTGSDPFRARGLRSILNTSGRKTPNPLASTARMNKYSEFNDHDLSPLRADYSLSPLAPDLSPSRTNGPLNSTASGGYLENYGNTSYLSPGYGHDYNSNVLSSSGKNAESYGFGSGYYHSNTGRDINDLNRSAGSSHHSEHKEPATSGSNAHGYTRDVRLTPRIRRVRDETLRHRMNDENGRTTTTGRSRSAGDPLNREYTGQHSPHARTPSAPANLNHSTTHSPTDRYGTYSTNNSVFSAPNHSAIPVDIGAVDSASKEPIRSIMSGEYRVHDSGRTKLSSVSLRVPGDTLYNRQQFDYSHLNYSHSFSPDPNRTGATPNGNAKLLSDKQATGLQKQDSISKSSLSTTEKVKQGSVFNRDYGIVSGLVTLLFMSILSLVVAFIAAQLLFRLNVRSTSGAVSSDDNSLLTNDSYTTTLEVTTALTTFVFMLDICCLLACSMQFFYAVKLARCSQGDERCYKYLKDCAATRFIAITGFFISLPILLLSFLLYMLLEYKMTASIIALVILSVGIAFTFVVGIHSTYIWRVEKTKADENVPPYDSKQTPSKSELSTLV